MLFRNDRHGIVDSEFVNAYNMAAGYSVFLNGNSEYILLSQRLETEFI